MKKLLFVSIFCLVFVLNSFAAPMDEANYTRESNSARKLLITKVFTKQCNVKAFAYTCEEALAIFDAAFETTSTICAAAGYGSQICADYIIWQGNTLAWASGVCGNEPPPPPNAKFEKYRYRKSVGFSKVS